MKPDLIMQIAVAVMGLLSAVAAFWSASSARMASRAAAEQLQMEKERREDERHQRRAANLHAHLDGERFILRNDGEAIARNVRIEILNTSAEHPKPCQLLAGATPRDIGPNTELTYRALFDSETPRHLAARLAWTDDNGAQAAPPQQLR